MNKTLAKWKRSIQKLSQNPLKYFKKKILKVFYKSVLRSDVVKSAIESEFLFVRTFNRAQQTPITKFSHSGVLGDLIYSIPTCKSLARCERFDIYLNLPKKALQFSNKAEDNISGFRPYFLTVFEQLKPLLDYQGNINLLQYSPEDYEKCFDLDIWRDCKKTITMPIYDMTKIYQYVFPSNIDVTIPWLRAPKYEKYSNAIVCTRNERWMNKKISYDFLKNYPEVYFIGLENEYKDLNVPEIKFLPVKDFLDAATIINSCKVFVSSQTFFFSLAEALKAPRVLEVCPKTPDVRPNGGICCECVYQDCLEYAVKKIYEGTF